MKPNEPRKIHAVVVTRNNPRSFPDRNVYPLFGRPLVGWVLASLKLAHHVDEVFVSTNDEAVGDVARGAGCSVIPRPEDLDHDRASRVEIVRHAVTWMYKERFLDTDVVISVRATIPELRRRDIDDAVDFLDRNNLRELVSVSSGRVQNDHLRLIHRRALFTTSLSTGIGVVKTGYRDVQSLDDIAALQAHYESRDRFDAISE